MSSPVDVQVKISSLLTFEKACVDSGLDVERVEKENEISGLTIKTGGYYGNVELSHSQKSGFSLHGEDYKIKEVQDKVMALYSAYQVLEMANENQLFRVPDNALQQQANGNVLIQLYRKS